MKNSYDEQWPDLDEFVAVCFHEDMDLEYPAETWQESARLAVEAFFRSNTDQVQRVRNQLKELLDQKKSEAELAQALRAMYLHWDFSPYRQWLESVLAHIESFLQAAPSDSSQKALQDHEEDGQAANQESFSETDGEEFSGTAGNTSDDRLRREELKISGVQPLEPLQQNAQRALPNSTVSGPPVATSQPKNTVTGFLSSYQSLSYALLRLVFGFLFACHGAQKLFGILGSHAVPHNSLLFIAGIIEFGGGALIFLGLLTRSAAFVASGEMAVAYFMVHAKYGLFPIMNRGELAVIYCFVALIVAAKGAGQFSVDKRLSGSKP